MPDGPVGRRACPNRHLERGPLVVPLYGHSGELQVKDISGMSREEAMEHWARILLSHAPFWLWEAAMGDGTTGAGLLRDKMLALAEAEGLL